MVDALAIVTGGTKGLGRALSLELAAADYRVLALYRSDDEAARTLVEESDGKVECQRCDVSRGAPTLPAASFSNFVLVHAAVASFDLTPLHLVSPDELTVQWEVAARGLLTCAQPLLRYLPRTRSGTIVTVSSHAAIGPGAPPRGFAPYASAKAAMTMLLRGLAHEYRDRGLRAFSVAPGFMNTALTERWPAHVRHALAGAGTSLPAAVAHRIRILIEDPTIPADGEEYVR